MLNHKVGEVLILDRDIARQLSFKKCLTEFHVHSEAIESLEDIQLYADKVISIVLLHFEFTSGRIKEVCDRLRLQFYGCRIIILVDEFSPDIEGLLFEFGADDVVCVTQRSTLVVVRRVVAHLRNLSSHERLARKVTVGDIIVHLDRQEVYRDGCRYPVKGVLLELLKYFIENFDRVISREELEQSSIWSKSVCTSVHEGGKTYDVHIGKLRRILERNPHKPEIIESVRGKGWRLGKVPSLYADQDPMSSVSTLSRGH